MYSWKDKINLKHFLLTAAPCLTRMIYTISVGHTLVNRNSTALTVCAGLLLSAWVEGNKDAGREQRCRKGSQVCMALPMTQAQPCPLLAALHQQSCSPGRWKQPFQNSYTETMPKFGQKHKQTWRKLLLNRQGSRGQKAFRTKGYRASSCHCKDLPQKGHPCPKQNNLLLLFPEYWR